MRLHGTRLCALAIGQGKGVHVIDLPTAVDLFSAKTSGEEGAGFYDLLQAIGTEGQGFGETAIVQSVFIDTGFSDCVGQRRTIHSMSSDRSRTHRSLSNVAAVGSGPTLPYSRVSALAETAGALHIESGVLVSRNDGIRLYSHDLRVEHWHHPIGFRSEMVRWNDSLFAGPVDGELLEIEASTGSTSRRMPCPIDGLIETADDRVVVVAGVNQVGCVAVADGRLLWQEEWQIRRVASLGGQLYMRRGLGDDLACVDIESGVCQWAFRAESEGSGGKDDRSHVIFDYGVFPDYVVVVTQGGRVYKLDPQTGRVIATARPEVLGLPLVTGDSVFFKGPDRLLEFSHRSLREVGRLEYGRDLRKIWTQPPSAVNAYCVTTESVIWTTLAGVIFGIDRRLRGGAREVWLDRLEALMPIYQPPFVGGDYLYYEPKRSAAGLVCYAAAR